MTKVAIVILSRIGPEGLKCTMTHTRLFQIPTTGDFPVASTPYLDSIAPWDTPLA